MFWLYLFIAIIIFAVSMYIVGRHFSDEHDVGGFIFTAAVGSIARPLLLAAIIVFGPFFGLYHIGAKRAVKDKENKAKK